MCQAEYHTYFEWNWHVFPSDSLNIFVIERFENIFAFPVTYPTSNPWPLCAQLLLCNNSKQLNKRYDSPINVNSYIKKNKLKSTAGMVLCVSGSHGLGSVSFYLKNICALFNKKVVCIVSIRHCVYLNQFVRISHLCFVEAFLMHCFNWFNM